MKKDFKASPLLSLRIYFLPFLFALVFFCTGWWWFLSFDKEMAEPPKLNLEYRLSNYYLVEDKNILELEISENSLNLFLYEKSSNIDDIYTMPKYYKANRLNEDMSYNELFRIDKPYLVCKYLHVNKNWYIFKDDMEKCSKNEAVKEINKLALEVNNHFKAIKLNKDSWEDDKK